MELDQSQRKKWQSQVEKRVFQSISRKLVSIDPEIACEYLNWLDRKTTYFRHSIDKVGYGSQPDNLARGDVIWVEFGINVGTELSDYKTRGHYALVWAIDLGNVVVIPLSSRDAPGSEMTFDIGIIPELNEKNQETHSFLKLDAIRSVSKRRIARMSGKPSGKITLSSENLTLVEQAIRLAFLSETQNDDFCSRH